MKFICMKTDASAIRIFETLEEVETYAGRETVSVVRVSSTLSQSLIMILIKDGQLWSEEITIRGEK